MLMWISTGIPNLAGESVTPILEALIPEKAPGLCGVGLYECSPPLNGLQLLQGQMDV